MNRCIYYLSLTTALVFCCPLALLSTCVTLRSPWRGQCMGGTLWDLLNTWCFTAMGSSAPRSSAKVRWHRFPFSLGQHIPTSAVSWNAGCPVLRQPLRGTIGRGVLGPAPLARLWDKN